MMINKDGNGIDICIVQLSRFGDVIQTIQSLKLLRSFDNKSRVLFIGRKQFCSELDFLLKEYCDQVYLLDIKSEFDKKYGSKKTWDYLSNFLNQVNAYKIEYCINLTFSPMSAYFCKLIKANDKFGLYKDEYDKLLIKDKWSQYVFSTVMRGNTNPFNLVDVFVNIIKQIKTKTKNININININTNINTNVSSNIINMGPNSEISTNLFGDRDIENKSDLSMKRETIIIHPFASQHKKKWPMIKWAYVINYIVSSIPNLTVIIVGSKAERKQADVLYSNELIIDIRDRVKNKVGETNIVELYRLLQNSSLFVGHDSMCGHLASLADVKSVTISLGVVRPHETMPYGEGNFNITSKVKCFPCFPDTPCSELFCHQTISPNLVAKFVLDIYENSLDGYVDEFYFPRIEDYLLEVEKKNVIIYQSYFDNFNNQILYPKFDDCFESNELFKGFYYILWNFILNDREVLLPIYKINGPLEKELKNNLEGLKYLLDLNVFGEQYSKFLLEELSNKNIQKDKIKEYSEKLKEVDGLFQMLRDKYPLMAPIVDYYYVLKNNIDDNELMKLASSYYLGHKEMECAFKVIQEFIERILLENRKSNDNIRGERQISS